jgi:catechol-2,3-dioxygenase
MEKNEIIEEAVKAAYKCVSANSDFLFYKQANLDIRTVEQCLDFFREYMQLSLLEQTKTETKLEMTTTEKAFRKIPY